MFWSGLTWMTHPICLKGRVVFIRGGVRRGDFLESVAICTIKLVSTRLPIKGLCLLHSRHIVSLIINLSSVTDVLYQFEPRQPALYPFIIHKGATRKWTISLTNLSRLPRHWGKWRRDTMLAISDKTQAWCVLYDMISSCMNTLAPPCQVQIPMNLGIWVGSHQWTEGRDVRHAWEVSIVPIKLHPIERCVHFWQAGVGGVWLPHGAGLRRRHAPHPPQNGRQVQICGTGLVLHQRPCVVCHILRFSGGPSLRRLWLKDRCSPLLSPYILRKLSVSLPLFPLKSHKALCSIETLDVQQGCDLLSKNDPSDWQNMCSKQSLSPTACFLLVKHAL